MVVTLNVSVFPASLILYLITENSPSGSLEISTRGKEMEKEEGIEMRARRGETLISFRRNYWADSTFTVFLARNKSSGTMWEADCKSAERYETATLLCGLLQQNCLHHEEMLAKIKVALEKVEQLFRFL